MVKPRVRGVHAERATADRRPAFPQRAARSGPPTSELGKQLRPDRDHPHEKHDRRQRRRFFHEDFQHARLLDYWNIKRTMFRFRS